ncbi:hypothetical protein [uncultured Tissierella sp.]|uniref:hypothetical protein n=1 Tax=uncultured Tissierella sp. TaxID=448160 RepID=UPI0028041F61|nr:hypothetical protein [uncultured Tissierella sp.]MDU5081372.1 hypothetical protein [Bacillota bacterium]
MKKISVLALILALSISLTGCVGGESKLYNAFNKMQDITSIESKMEMGFTFEAEGFSEEEQLMLEQVKAMVNNSKIAMNQKAKYNKEKTVGQAQVDMNMNFGGMGMDMNVWVDMDMSTDELKIKEVIKMPQMLMSSMFPNDPAKQYIVLDMGQMMKEENAEMNFNELMKFGKEFQPKLTEFMKEMQKDFKPGIEVVKQKDSKVVNKEKLDIYELKMDDAALKGLVKDAVNYSLDKKEVIEFIKEYMNAVMSVVVLPEGEKEAAEAEVKQGLADLEKQLPEFKVKFNEFMEKYKDVKILGDKGIVIEFGINKKGYIVHEVGTIDLRIDLGQIAEVVGEKAPEMKGIIKLGISYTSKSYNINSKDVKVEMHKVDEKNSIDYMKMMEMQMKQIEQLQQAPAK